MKAQVYKIGWVWYAEAELEPGNPLSRYTHSFKTWHAAIDWALNPTSSIVNWLYRYNG